MIHLRFCAATFPAVQVRLCGQDAETKVFLARVKHDEESVEVRAIEPGDYNSMASAMARVSGVL